MASTNLVNTIPRRPVPTSNPLDDRRCKELTTQYRQILSTKRINELGRMTLDQRESQVYPHIDRDYGTAIYTPSSSSRRSNATLRNLPLMPEVPVDARSQRFRNKLHMLSQFPIQWENPGLLDEAMKVIPLQQICSEAEEESNLFQAEAESLGPQHFAVWGYQDCVIRSLLRWFKRSFFSWVDSPACTTCGNPTVGIGMAAPTPDETARSAIQVELYQCRSCNTYVRFPRYNDAFVLLQRRKGRVGEWVQCFGMLCRAMGSRVRWIWNSEDHVWLEVYSLHRRRWIHVDPCEQAWDRPKLYTEGWNRKLGYCIAFSNDGAIDVTRRYVRNFTKHAAKRDRVPESVLLYILNEIRNLRRKDLSKQDKFRLEGEDMRESKELRHYAAQAIAAEVCSIIVDARQGGAVDANGRLSPSPPSTSTPPNRGSDADGAKALEARLEEEARAVNRTQTSSGGPGVGGPNGGRQSPRDPYQRPT